jgi:hypothetical protein
MKRYFHLCRIEDTDGINECYENEDGRLWFIYGDNPKSTQVNYCPYCGFESEEPLEMEGEDHD